jgi:hypothetical protein
LHFARKNERVAMSDPIRGSYFFETPPDYVNALNTLLAGAHRIIRIYDWDLSDGGYEAPARIALLNDFCKQGLGRELKILLADDGYLKRDAGQMMRLLSVWGHVLHVRVRPSEPPPAHDCFVLVDEIGALKRFDKDQARGVMRPDSRSDVVDLGLRFDAEWGRAERRVSAHTLGL